MKIRLAAEKRSPFHIARLCCTVLACQLAFTHASLSQSTIPFPEIPSTKYTFDVVSIRPSSDDERWHGRQAVSDNEYFAIYRPLGVTVLRAYLPVTNARRENLLNAPAWLWNDNYDLVGKVAPEDAAEFNRYQRNWLSTNPVLQSMLQYALKERCGLTVHRVTVERNGYALVQSKPPVHLRPATGTETIPKDAIPSTDGGHFLSYWPGQEPKMTFYTVSMKGFAEQLSAFVGQPIEDRTGLSGTFDFVLPMHTEAELPAERFDVRSLGLELKPIKVEMDAIQIDHIDKPTPN